MGAPASSVRDARPSEASVSASLGRAPSVPALAGQALLRMGATFREAGPEVSPQVIVELAIQRAAACHPHLPRVSGDPGEREAYFTLAGQVLGALREQGHVQDPAEGVPLSLTARARFEALRSGHSEAWPWSAPPPAGTWQHHSRTTHLRETAEAGRQVDPALAAWLAAQVATGTPGAARQVVLEITGRVDLSAAVPLLLTLTPPVSVAEASVAVLGVLEGPPS